jgi:hypothetical protein
VARISSSFPVVEDVRQVQFGGDDRSGLGAFVGADDTLAFEGVDYAARPGVADPEAALHRAHRGLLRGDHEARRLGQEVILGLCGLFLLGFRLRYPLDEVSLGNAGGTGGFDACGDHVVDLRFSDEGALDAGGPEGRDGLEEHVALAEECLSA